MRNFIVALLLLSLVAEMSFATTYTVCFTNGGVPATGLSPTWESFVYVETEASAGSPSFNEIASTGCYKFVNSPSADIVGFVDGGASLSNTDRYKQVYLTPDDANIVNLDTTVSSRAPANTALSNAVWTDTKAGYLDASISSRSSHSASDITGGTTVAQAESNIRGGSDSLATLSNQIDGVSTFDPSTDTVLLSFGQVLPSSPISNTVGDALKSSGEKLDDIYAYSSAVYDEVVTHPTLSEMLSGGVAKETSVFIVNTTASSILDELNKGVRLRRPAQ